MSTKKIKFIESLKGRILVFLTLPTILIIVTLVAIIANASYSSARIQAEFSLKQAAQLVSLEIERRSQLIQQVNRLFQQILHSSYCLIRLLKLKSYQLKLPWQVKLFPRSP